MSQRGYHSRDGWYWQRLPNGNVRVVITQTSDIDSPVVREQVLPENEWASVVSSVSREGETYDRWMAARTFHGTGAP